MRAKGDLPVGFVVSAQPNGSDVTLFHVDHARCQVIAQQFSDGDGHRAARLSATDDEDPLEATQVIAPLGDVQPPSLAAHVASNGLLGVHSVQRRGHDLRCLLPPGVFFVHRLLLPRQLLRSRRFQRLLHSFLRRC